MRRASGVVLATVVALLVAACGGYVSPATNVSATQATLNGSVSCNGGDANAGGTPCEYYWEWGTVASGGYPNTSPVQGPVNANVSNVPVRYDVSGLQPSTQYQFKLCGKGDGITSFECVGPQADQSAAQTFRTKSGASPPPVSWSEVSPSLPAGDSGVLAGVSCLSGGSCVAVGTTCPSASCESSQGIYGAGTVPLVEVFDGSTWTRQSVPLPAGAIGAELNAVSCRSVRFCLAVGEYSTADTTLQTGNDSFAARYDGTAWTSQALNITDGGQRWPGGTDETAISCASTTYCVAGGYGRRGTARVGRT